MKIIKKRILRSTNPHEIEFLGHQYLDNPELQLFKYNKDTYSENSNYKADGDFSFEVRDEVSWLNVHGIHDIDLIRKICKNTGIPRFIVQDIVDTNQRTKIQDIDKYIFLTVKSILPGREHDIEIEQISFLLGQNILYSFQEKKGDHFEHVRTRIREDNGLVREKGADFLLYLLLEGIIANFYTTIDQMDENIKEQINIIDIRGSDPSVVEDIESYKRKLQRLRSNVLATRDMLQSIEKEDSLLIKAEQKKYYYALKDNSMHLLDDIDVQLQRLDSAENLFFSLQGHRMNLVMTTLTILAAIFIPLTFMAGIYGMNFEYMPELKWKYGYFVALGAMFLIGIGLIIYFRRKKWI